MYYLKRANEILHNRPPCVGMQKVWNLGQLEYPPSDLTFTLLIFKSIFSFFFLFICHVRMHLDFPMLNERLGLINFHYSNCVFEISACWLKIIPKFDFGILFKSQMVMRYFLLLIVFLVNWRKTLIFYLWDIQN